MIYMGVVLDTNHDDVFIIVCLIINVFVHLDR
jgi:hypothetical protein